MKPKISIQQLQFIRPNFEFWMIHEKELKSYNLATLKEVKEFQSNPPEADGTVFRIGIKDRFVAVIELEDRAIVEFADSPQEAADLVLKQI